LHGTRLNNWEFYPYYNEFLEDYVDFNDLDLKKIVDKFVDFGLIRIADLGNGVVLCKYTDRVTR
jgi:hypothetical protein